MTGQEHIVSLPLPGSPDAFGLLALPREGQARIGVLIVVGGPQYRVGAHRHFVQLARRLADAGFACLRFDHRGVGDAVAPLRSFEDLDEDLAAALDALSTHQPQLEGVVLWGLCDAAAAALLYQARRADARVRGMVLINPWVRSAQGKAQALVQHYYGARLRDPAFWRKVLGGGVGLAALRSWLANRRAAAAPSTPSAGFQSLMAKGWFASHVPLLLQLSPADLTAQEFLGRAATDPAWHGWAEREHLTRLDYIDADHTFSDVTIKRRSIDDTVSWLHHLL